MVARDEIRQEVGFVIELTNNAYVKIKIDLRVTGYWFADIKIGGDGHYYSTFVEDYSFDEVITQIGKKLQHFRKEADDGK